MCVSTPGSSLSASLTLATQLAQVIATANSVRKVMPFAADDGVAMVGVDARAKLERRRDVPLATLCRQVDAGASDELR